MAAKQKIQKGTIPEYVGTKEMANLLGVSEKWLGNLVADGIVPKFTHGTFRPHDVIAAYIEHKAASAAPPQEETPNDKLKESRRIGQDMINAQRARDLIPMDEATMVVDYLIGAFTSFCSILPSAIAQSTEERRRIEAIVDDRRTRLSVDFREGRTALEEGREPGASEEQTRAD